MLPQTVAGGLNELYDCKSLNDRTSSVASTVRTTELSDRVTLQIIDVNGNITWVTLPIKLDEAVSIRSVSDVNGDGLVNVLDLVLVSINFGKTGENVADVNGDKIVNIVDLVKVAGEIGGGGAAPAVHPKALEILTARRCTTTGLLKHST